MENLIAISGVSKKYFGNTILQNVNLDIKRGDSITLIGHNGSGKSTLLKIIGNLVKYNTGQIDYKKNIKISYVPENFTKINLKAINYVTSIAQIEGMNKVDAKRRSKELFEKYYMSNMLYTPLKYLSKGSLQKVAVMQAILQKPDVLLLDEPLSGQDSDSQKTFIHTVKCFNEEGTAIIMSCHEKWLMNALAKTVYEISNNTLVKKTEFIANTLEYTVMTFGKKLESENPANYLNINIEDFILKMEKKEQKTVLYVKKESSNVVLLKMLNNGYELRGMSDEVMD